MLRIALINFILTMTISSHADGPFWFVDAQENNSVFSLQDCIFQAQRNGPEIQIKNDCFSIFYKSATNDQKKISANENIFVLGSNNALFTREKIKDSSGNIQLIKRSIAGSYSKLNEILSVDLRSDNKETAVLNKAGNKFQILVFDSERNGNVVPLRIIEHSVIENAARIRYQQERGEIYVISPSNNAVYALPSNSDYRSPRPHEKVQVIFALEALGVQPFTPIDVAASVTHNDLAVLENDKISIFKFSGNEKPKLDRSISGALTQIQNSQSITYEKQADCWSVTDVAGKKISFKRLSQGNIVPDCH